MVDELRVTTWKGYVGQEALKHRLDVHIKAALRDERYLDHVLLYGPPGFGKTSLATIIAARMGKKLAAYTMPLQERALIRVLQGPEEILLLDEIHRASKTEQEALLPLVESGCYQTSRGQPFYRKNLTIIGATTEIKDVIEPLRDRFGIKPDFDEYTVDEMGKIVSGMCSMVKVKLPAEDCRILGNATGGVPRRARDFILAARDLENPTAQSILEFCRTDETGLTLDHQRYMQAMAKSSGLAGLSTLTNHLRVNERVVRDIERLLVKQNLVTYTERGRELTGEGWAKVNSLAA